MKTKKKKEQKMSKVGSVISSHIALINQALQAGTKKNKG
jgi:hypothetical protein